MANEQEQAVRLFDRDLQAFSRKLDIDLVTTVKKVTFDLFGRIVTHTPVDTGRARASWNVGIDAPNESTQPEAQYAQHKANPAVAAQATAVSALENLQPYADVWISNNLPYIGELENGHSRQAPSGMVAISIQETELELDVASRAAS